MKFSILLTTLALAEKRSFDSDVSKVMDILVHSLYKTKDIFLRELVSNSADALEKIRLTDSENLGIKIKAESDTRTLVIEDNGVGMTRDELVQNLGTIANSGTSKLIQNPDLIGKFGVGFYSVFLVSDNVTVYSKSDGGDQYVWSSDSKGYTLDKDPNGNTLSRGTRIEIKLKDDAVDFAKPEVLEDILKKHSEFIKFPIYLWKEKTVEKDTVTEKSEEKENDDGEAIVEDASDKQEAKPDTVVVSDWEQVNSQQPIWLRDPSTVNEEDYTEFFKTHYKQFQAPLKVGHFKIEGQNTFNVLMFIPESVPQSFLTRDQDNTKNSVELFVRRVFISDEFVSFLPNWLNFVKVILDSDDLPLNVNREHIQTHASLKLVQKKIVSKSLDLLMEVAQDDAKYKPVYESYGKALKIGVHESRSTAHVQSKLLDLLRFESTKSNFTSLKAYKEGMSENQKQIYFSTGSNTKQARSNPLAERLMAKNLEVLLMIDPIEEYLAQNDMKSYDSIPLQDVVKPGLILDTGSIN